LFVAVNGAGRSVVMRLSDRLGRYRLLKLVLSGASGRVVVAGAGRVVRLSVL